MNTAQLSSSSSDERRGKEIEAQQLLSKVLLRVYGVCNPYRFKKQKSEGRGGDVAPRVLTALMFPCSKSTFLPLPKLQKRRNDGRTGGDGERHKIRKG